MSESAAAPQTTAPAAEVAPVAPAAAPEAAPVATPAAAPAEPTEKPAEQAEAPTAEASSKPEAQTTEAQATEPVAVTAAPTEPVAVTAASTVPEAAPATEAEAPKEAEKAAEPTAPAPAAAAASVPAPAAEAAAPAAAAVPVPEAIPAPAEKPAQSGPVWPALAEDHPLAKFQARLPELLNHAGYSKIWGITLSAAQPVPFHTTLILQKFLRANSNNIDAAYAQLLETLAWRKTYEPDVAVGETFDGAKFSGLGYVTRIPTKGGEKVITWNLYGACKEPKKTFGDLDSFLRWRIALMELGVNALNLASATEPIPDYNAAAPGSAVDPYQMIQLHDYYNVSFFRLDGATKAASKKTIDVMARYYPELLSTTLFVNVPTLMGWVFTFMKTFLSKETVRKFQVVTSGKDVANTLGDAVPKSYGGQGSDLAAIGLTPKLEAAAPKAESVKSDKPKSKAASVKSAVPAEKPAAAAVVPVVEEAPVPAPPAKDVVVPEAAPEAPPKDDAKALPVVPAAAVEETPAPAPVEPAVPVAEETKPAAPVVEEPKPEVTTAPEDATKAVDAPAADAPKVPAVAVAEAVSEEKKPATTA